MNGEYADYLKPLTVVALNTGARRSVRVEVGRRRH
jgi:hypothetical protein